MSRRASDTRECEGSHAFETSQSRSASSVPDEIDLSGIDNADLEFLVALGRLGDGLAGRQCVLQIEFDLVAVHDSVGVADFPEFGQ